MPQQAATNSKAPECNFFLVILSLFLLDPPAETWPSGRRRSPAKGVTGKLVRGFESLRLRHYPKVI